MRHKFAAALLLLGRASAAPTGALQPDYVLPSLPDAERPSTPGESPVTPLASSYGWRNLYVRIPSAICGSLDCIAG